MRNEDMTLPAPTQIVRLYCCYAERDKRDWDELHAHLAPLRRLGRIELRHNHSVPVGHNIVEAHYNHLETVDIVLLIVSHYFFHSDQCCELMNHAMEKHRIGELQVIPIWLNLVYYKGLGTSIDELETLPREKPIKKWSNRQEAYMKVVEGICRIIDRLRGEDE